MISKITLRNFQSHKNTEIDLHPNVNVFIGESDHGKSAVLRGIDWPRINRPSGDGFRSDWGGDTTVKIETKEGNSITREKTDKINRYVLTTPVKEIEFKAMGKDVPAEITAALNLPNFNVQYQMDPPFLVSSSAGDVTQVLNEIAGLDVISYAQSNIDAKIREIKSDLAHEEANLAASKEKLGTYDYLTEVEEKLRSLEATHARAEDFRNRKYLIEKVVWSIKGIQERLDKLSHIDAAGRWLNELIWTQHEADNKRLTVTTLNNVVSNIMKTTTQILEHKKILKLEPEVDELIAADKRAEELYTRVRTIDEIVKKIIDTNYKIAKAELTLQNTEKWWKENAPDICPLCGKGKLNDILRVEK